MLNDIKWHKLHGLSETIDNDKKPDDEMKRKNLFFLKY
jgi:hypothetical protein